MYDFEITKREVLVSIAILFLMLGLGFLLSSNISGAVEESNERYHKALKISDDVTYEYAKQTGVGNAFTTYNLVADNPQSFPELVGDYLYVERVYEVEEQKTRIVTETHTDSDGNTYTTERVETYWEWDIHKRERLQSPTVTFNGDHYSTGKFSGYPEHWLDINDRTIHKDQIKWYQLSSRYWYVSSHKRYSYSVIPKELSGSAYLNFQNGDIEGTVHLSSIKDPQEMYRSYVSSPVGWLVLFWVVWVIVTGLLIFGFYYIDNRWLED